MGAEAKQGQGGPRVDSSQLNLLMGAEAKQGQSPCREDSVTKALGDLEL